MDAQADGLYSRPPEVHDLVTLCRSLNREGVRYVLVGGFAVVLQGFARTTGPTFGACARVWMRNGSPTTNSEGRHGPSCTPQRPPIHMDPFTRTPSVVPLGAMPG